MKKYETYKDSGIEWIGQIPEHWEVIPMKHYFYMKGRIGWQGLKADEFLEEGPYLVTGTDFENGKVCWERCYHISEERYNEAPEIHVERGDLLITKDGTVGKLALINEKPEKVSLNSHLLILRPYDNNIDNHFTYWALQSVVFKDYVGLSSSGSTMASLSQEKIGSFLLVLPTFIEQQAIADYLDYKVGQIDKYVADIDRQIEDLKAYRQSVISEAVTKGLNPDAPMKDSGIEWIGMMPTDWNSLKIKNIFKVIAGATPDSNKPEYWDGDIVWVTPADFKSTDHYISSGKRFITKQGFESCATTLVPIGSIIFSKRAPIGSVVIAQNELCTNQGCLSCVPTSKANSNFYYYALSVFTQALEMYGSGTTFKEISAFDFSNFRIPYPTIQEQQAIADFLDKKTSIIDSSIKSLEVQRDDLNALRQSIISEAVTGKIDVRDWKIDK